MNSPFAIPAPAKLAPIEDVFRARCDALAVLYLNGQIPLCDAVDQLQAYAEQSGLVDVIGQDEAQEIMAAAFFFADFGQTDDADRDEDFRDASEIVRRWELADPRDRWQHTGEAPPPERIRNSDVVARPATAAARHRTPQATRDAFTFMARQGDAVALAAWLANHPLNAPDLLSRISHAR